MVDPQAITKFDRTATELEEFWLFCLFVAGKNAAVQARKLDALLADVGYPTEPLRKLMWWKASQIEALLRKHRIGQYQKLTRAIQGCRPIDRVGLEAVRISDLETIHGVGPKTARFFVLHSRRNQQVAALDTHILAWLRDLGVPAPRTTPTGKRYAALERIFLAECRKRRISPAKFDLQIWNSRSKNGRKSV